MLIQRFLFEIESQNTLGENVLWNSFEQVLYWTDIEEKRLYRWNAHTAVTTDIELPFRMSSFAFTKKSGVLLAAFDQGIAEYSLEDGALQWLASPEASNEHTRFNDGKCDTKGRYWIGSMVENGVFHKLNVEQQGALYCADWLDRPPQNKTHSDLRLSQHLSGLHISNGLAFNQDSSIMYHADSPKHSIQAYSLDPKGYIVNKVQFAKFEKHCFPDGACVDCLDNLWTAVWGGGYIACFSKTGKLLQKYPLPVTQPSCVCIGGPNMDWIFVTSARAGLSQKQLANQPSAGNVLVYQLQEALGREEPIAKLS